VSCDLLSVYDTLFKTKANDDMSMEEQTVDLHEADGSRTRYRSGSSMKPMASILAAGGRTIASTASVTLYGF
jgi:hypothetical protein